MDFGAWTVCPDGTDVRCSVGSGVCPARSPPASLGATPCCAASTAPPLLVICLVPSNNVPKYSPSTDPCCWHFKCKQRTYTSPLGCTVMVDPLLPWRGSSGRHTRAYEHGRPCACHRKFRPPEYVSFPGGWSLWRRSSIILFSRPEKPGSSDGVLYGPLSFPGVGLGRFEAGRRASKGLMTSGTLHDSSSV